MAPSSALPPQVLSAIHKSLGICYLRLGESDLAVEHLDRAAVFMQRRDYDLGQLQIVARDEPEVGIDRAIDRSSIPDHERPMWEAFEELGQAPRPGR